jgi:predicted CoA-substrate-specific enzyme activase
MGRLDPHDGPPAGRERLLGLDVGGSLLKVVLCDPDGSVRHKGVKPARGRPAAAFAELLDEIRPDPCAGERVRIAVTGSAQALSHLFPCSAVNEVIATARGVGEAYPLARTAIDLGGQFSKWIQLGDVPGQPGSVVDFASNGLCAAGAGAFLEQQASRLGLDVDALGRLAARAPRAASIAGRCSVFAKSDMIHLQQKGTPPDEIAYGLCLALARTFLATVVSGRLLSPQVVLVGGGACNPGLLRAFRALLKLDGAELFAADDGVFLGALGAARSAASAPVADLSRVRQLVEQGVACAPREAPRDRAEPSRLVSCADASRPKPPVHGASRLRPLTHPSAGLRASGPEDPVPVCGDVTAYLGVDVGSVSTNLVLLGREFELLQGAYLPTRGRPVEVLQEGLALIRKRFDGRLNIRAVGTTGSGRHLAARLLGADVVHNEITAQMVSALRYLPQADTIFEIGGQDSKYISIRDGHLADFEMNKICAGGTGSFLEEEAERLGVSIIGEFAALALQAGAPCDLGARCTVFMDSELVGAQDRGASLPDICAGLAYSVARNYLEKVVGGRPVGARIVFQGGTASNAAVVQAFRNLLGREVAVHPYNRISGAIGAALLAARAGIARSAFLGFESCDASDLTSFTCQHCENRCQVNRIQAGARVLHFGDVCERYSERDVEHAAAVRPFAELFASRERLFERAVAREPAGAGGAPKIGLLRSSLNLEFVPFWTAFLRELGYEPVVSGKTSPEMLQKNAGGVPAEICLPIKAAAAQARGLLESGAVERVFVPALLECPPRDEEEQSHTCLYGQQLPDLLRAGLGGRVVPCQFSLRRGLLSIVEPVLTLAETLDRSIDLVARALLKAEAAQAVFDQERQRLGREALAADFARAVVVLGRPYNTHDSFLNLAVARHLERLNMPAIPWDLLPLAEVQLDPRWNTVPWYYNREQLRAIEIVRRDHRLFPLLVSSYGCGPDGFIVKHLDELVADRPRLLLEFDEHRAEAGLVTRLEAFSDEIDEHLGRSGAAVRAHPADRLTPGRSPAPAGRRFFIPRFSAHAGIYAAVLRSAGYQAEVLPAPDRDTVHLGEQLASGRECHPYAIVGGDLARLAANTERRPGDVFLFPNCTTPCLLNQYGDGYRLALERRPHGSIQVWEATTPQLTEIVGVPAVMRLYEGLLAIDILIVLGSRLGPYQTDREEFDARLEASYCEMARLTEARKPLDEAIAGLAADLWARPRTGSPGSRPVVGITGDAYSRLNPLGYADLFRRLEHMKVEVWPSPYFAMVSDLAAALNMPRRAGQGLLKAAALDYLSWTLTARIGRRLTRGLSPEVAALTFDPPVEELIRLARPYVGQRASHLVVLVVAKMADFLRRGATGVVNAVALNCMVGTATAALVPAIRADHGSAPILTLTYAGDEAPSQRIQLETFVEQVHARWRRMVA